MALTVSQQGLAIGTTIWTAPRASTWATAARARTSNRADSGFHPLGRRLNGRLRRLAGIRPAAALEPADGLDGHVLVACDLTRQPHTCQALFGQLHLFRLRHPRGLAADELDAARGAARVATARMQDIDPGVLFDGIDESLTRFDVHAAKTFYGQCRHVGMVTYRKIPGRKPQSQHPRADSE